MRGKGICSWHYENAKLEGLVEDPARLTGLPKKRLHRDRCLRCFCAGKLGAAGRSEGSRTAANSQLYSCRLGHADAFTERLQGDCRSEIGGIFRAVSPCGFRRAGGRAGDAKTMQRAGEASAASD